VRVTRDMLIKLLGDDHEPSGPYAPADSTMLRCGCGTWFDDHQEWAEHVADLILLGFAR
jgi:hypothetical protein